MVSRSERANRYGSPLYTYTAGVIAPAGVEYFNTQDQFPTSRKYGYLNWLRIVNNSGELINLNINEQDYGPIPAGVIQTVDNLAIWSVRIRNDDSANSTAAGEVVIQLQRAALTADAVARGETL